MERALSQRKDEMSAVEDYTLLQAQSDLPSYGQESHKYTHGTLLVTGGSRQYPGAPMLSAIAGLYAGAGVVVACLPESAQHPGPCPFALIVHRVPEDPSRGVFCGASLEAWQRELPKATALVLGPGMGNHPEVDVFLAEALAVPRPKVVDADALNRISCTPALLPGDAALRRKMVLTPHDGEARRLCRAFGVPEELGRQERTLALSSATGCVVVGKGAGTLVATPEGTLTRNASGNPRLATAGSGDVLSGVIGALLAQGLVPEAAARLGVFLHGAAADNAKGSFLADDLCRMVGDAVAALKSDSLPWKS